MKGVRLAANGLIAGGLPSVITVCLVRHGPVFLSYAKIWNLFSRPKMVGSLPWRKMRSTLCWVKKDLHVL